MIASGNGNVQRCANNLLAITRGEVPYDRVRGLDGRAIDKPADEAERLIRQDAAWLMETYEPRGELKEIQITQDEAGSGLFRVTAIIE